MREGSLTFRAARAMAAGAMAAVRWLLVLALVVAIGLPLARIAVGWYVRGTVELVPPPASASSEGMQALAVGNATPSEAEAVRSAVASLRYRLDPRAVSVVLMDADPLDPAAQGEYVPYLGIIRLRRSLVDLDGPPLQWAVAHEIGHYVDERYMTDPARARFMRLRHIPSSLAWQATLVPWNERPDEDFAEVFAALSVPEAFTPPATVYGRVRDPSAVEALLASVGVTFGRPPPPMGWLDVVAREYAFLRGIVSDPRIARALLAILAAYVALAAIPPAARAWRIADGEGVPEERTLDRRMAQVLNTHGLVRHKGRRRYVTHTSRHHGGSR